MRRFDIGLLPLPDDPFSAGKSPVKCLQYMASGIPVVASPLAATREMVLEGISGFLPRNDEEWVRVLGALLQAPDQRLAMGQAARKIFQEQYRAARIAGMIGSLWRDLILPRPH